MAGRTAAVAVVVAGVAVAIVVVADHLLHKVWHCGERQGHLQALRECAAVCQLVLTGVRICNWANRWQASILSTAPAVSFPPAASSGTP